MSALAAFHDLLLPELPGCTVPMVNLHLRETLRMFCDKTSAWRQDLAGIDTVASQATYALALPASSELVRVTRLELHSILLWLDSDRRPAGNDEQTEPKYRAHEPPFTLDQDLLALTLAPDEVPTAAVTAGLEVRVALKPDMQASTVPDFLLERFGEAIRFGTLSRLMLMAGKPWSNAALAGFYLGEWHSWLNRAATQVQLGNTRHVLRVRKHG